MSTGVGMSACCLSGKVHTGKPTGRIDTLGGLQTYIAEPSGGSKAQSIVFITDSRSSMGSGPSASALPCHAHHPTTRPALTGQLL